MASVNGWRSGPVLTLAGPPGCGKSVAAGQGVMLWLTGRHPWAGFRSGRGPKWIRAESLGSIPSWQEVDESIAKAGLLVIDDVGIEAQRDDSAARVRSLLVYRHDDERPTIITTNLQWNHLRERYGSQVADRMGGSSRAGSHSQFVDCRSRERGSRINERR